jgi:hypothetical protein
MARIETGRKTVRMKTLREMILNNSVALFFLFLCSLRPSRLCGLSYFFGFGYGFAAFSLSG